MLKYKCYSVITILFILLALNRYVILNMICLAVRDAHECAPPLLAAQSTTNSQMMNMCPSV